MIQGFFVGGHVPASSVALAPARPAPGAAQRAFAPVQAKGAPPRVQAPAGRSQAPGATHVAVDPARLGLAPGRGQPLPQALLAKMERAFRADLSAVRVHVGPQPSRIGALAFTTGNDIYFSPGRYQPETVHGQQLIGHELTHVIQQREGRVRPPNGGTAIVHDRMLEAEADRMGARAAHATTCNSCGSDYSSAPVQAKMGWSHRATIQPMMMVGGMGPPPPPPPRILGINNRMAHGEALGNTGGKQTTISEAKINGVFIGKFDNRNDFMAHGQVVNPGNLAASYPPVCTQYWVAGHNTHKQGKPHSEDYVIAAVYQEHLRLGAGNWAQAYPRAPGQNFDLLSLKLDKTPCPNCARNLMRLCNNYGLRLRVKASTLNTAVSFGTGRTGSQILHAGRYGMASVPVRHWTVNQIHNYLGRVNKVQSPYTTAGFIKFQNLNNQATNQLPLLGNAEIGWSAINYGRKANQGAW